MNIYCFRECDIRWDVEEWGRFTGL